MKSRSLTIFLTVFLIVLLFLPLIHPAFATTIFSDGFESGNFSAWTGTSYNYYAPTVVSDYVHHGSYAAKCSSPNNGYSQVYKNLGSSYTTLYTRAYMRFDSLPTSSGIAIYLLSHADTQERLGTGWPANVMIKNDAGTVKWGVRYYAFGWYDAVSTSSPQATTWYCVELKTVFSSSGEIRLYIDGTEVLSVTGLDWSGGATDRIAIRSDVEGATFTATTRFDCVVVADTYIGTEAAAQEYSFSLTETVKPTSTLNIQQEHTYTFTGTIIQSSILSYSVEGIQEFIETLTQTVTSSGTTYYWMELSYSLTETAKPTATHSIGLEGIYTLIQTITPTETRIILQEQLYTLTQTTTLQTILTYAGELAEVFITNIETITPHEIITYWIESPIDWSIVAIGLAALAFVIAAAAIALK